jgi:hypothetical protein
MVRERHQPFTKRKRGSMHSAALAASDRHLGVHTGRSEGTLFRAHVLATKEMLQWSPKAAASAQYPSRGGKAEALAGETPDAEWVVVQAGKGSTVYVRDKDSKRLVALRVVKPPHISSLVARYFPGSEVDSWRAFARRLRSIQKGLPRLKRSSSEEGTKKGSKTVYLGLQGNPGNKKRRLSDGSPAPTNLHNPANDAVVATVALQELAKKRPAEHAFYLDVVAAVDADTRAHLGDEAAVNADAVGRIPAPLRKHLGKGVELFAQTEIISSTAFKAHYDTSCVPSTFSSVLVVGDGAGFAGGGQVLLQRGVELTVPQGTLIAARYGEELHGVTMTNASKNNNRVAVVAFVGSPVVGRAAKKMKKTGAMEGGKKRTLNDSAAGRRAKGGKRGAKAR